MSKSRVRVIRANRRPGPGGLALIIRVSNSGLRPGIRAGRPESSQDRGAAGSGRIVRVRQGRAMSVRRPRAAAAQRLAVAGAVTVLLTRSLSRSVVSAEAAALAPLAAACHQRAGPAGP
jgi:hypothetical protein